MARQARPARRPKKPLKARLAQTFGLPDNCGSRNSGN
jgi:hypothetical protein